ncbi:adventurous gliding motility protein CglE [Cystobacter fuscus]|uniref:adventurous gliding motility protein CglE n=1 Tax=Cystobacter fuscus TaxID=43 RepID=UPI002B3028CA|nr:adventurous gliding motility protein CglE [Cystobacter fuscus]
MKTPLLTAVLALLPTAALSATAPEGVPLEVRRGFFTEADIGVFFTVGGLNRYSNAQTYLQLGVGYDLSDRVSLGLHFGLGASAANCFASYLPGTNVCARSDNFSVVFADVTAGYLVPLATRFYLVPKLAAGLSRLDLAPTGTGDPAAPQTVPNAGVGIGVEYATPLDHFSVGADVMARYLIGPNIPTFAVFPRVKYTF